MRTLMRTLKIEMHAHFELKNVTSKLKILKSKLENLN